ncbi:phospholipase A2-like [Diadema antillarum]|uniref:phospholipase A2-like n=1 Tax=Diadema antillarum TaxID=105358 RepID=UPI003A877D95
MAVDKKWVICVAFTSVIVVMAVTVPLIVMTGTAPRNSAANVQNVEESAQGSRQGSSGHAQMVAEHGRGGGVEAAVAAGPDGGAMAPSNMVVQFGGMIDCLVRRGSLAYNGYGCYCGLGGSGKPLDATDRCCRQHDECYSRLKRQGICKGDKSVYITWYKVDMTQCDTPNAKITCSHHHQYSFFDSLLAGRQARCAMALCHCDRTSAFCFARHSASYNLDYAAYQGKKLC